MHISLCARHLTFDTLELMILHRLNAREGLRDRSGDGISFRLSRISTSRGGFAYTDPSSYNPSSNPFSKVWSATTPETVHTDWYPGRNNSGDCDPIGNKFKLEFSGLQAVSRIGWSTSYCRPDADALYRKSFPTTTV